MDIKSWQNIMKKGIGTKPDKVKAIKLYTKAVAEGCDYVLESVEKILAEYYELDETKAEQAAEWWRKDAENGSRHSMVKIGQYLLEGKGIPKDINAGIEWYKKAANEGLVDPAFKLGEIYCKGLDVPIDMEEGIHWYMEIYKYHEEASYALGNIYYEGINNIEKDYEKAFQFYECAALKGYSEAYVKVADMYQKGEGVAKDHGKAIDGMKKQRRFMRK